MTWGKLCDTLWMHPKIVEAGNECVGAWVRMISYSCSQLTDGVIPTAIARTITTPSMLRRLTAVRLLEQVENGWKVHDFSAYNPTRSDVEAARAKTAARVAEHRQNKANRSSSNARSNAVTDHVTNGVGNSVGTSVPTRPVPSHVEDTVAAAPLLSPAPTAQTTSSRGRARTGARAVLTGEAPPFGPAEAFGALASASGGRFAAGDASTWSAGQVIAARKLIRRHGDLETWRLVGEWLAAGGDRYRGTVGPSWATSALPDALARAQHWDAQGRPAIDGRALAVAEPPDPWVVAAARQGVRL